MKELYLSLKLKIACVFAIALLYFSPAFAQVEQLVFSETFDTSDDFNEWLVIDLNGGRAWEYHSSRKAAAYMLDYQTGLPGDDWIISPAFSLDASMVYELSFTTYVPNNNNTESLSASIGSERSAEGMTHQLIDLPALYKDNNGTYTAKIVVPSSGDYYLGFYAYSAANMIRVEVDNITITAISPTAVPSAVTNLQVNAAPEGALSATVNFTTPSINAGEAALDELSSITIYRNNSEAHTIESPGIGAEISWVDNSPSQGLNTYTVVATNSAGDSEPQSVTVYVGTDTPNPVTDVTAKLNTDLSTTISWQAPTGSTNGGYIDFDALCYTILRNGEEISTGIDGTSYIDEIPVDRGQEIVTYSVVAYNATGESVAASAGEIVCGTPLAAPYSESFAEGKWQDGAPWHQDAEVADIEWHVMGDDEEEEIATQDGDNGMLRARTTYAYSGDKSRFISPLLDLSGMTNPILSFYFYHAQSEWYDPAYDGEINDRIEVQLSVDGGEWATLNNATFYNGKDNDGWVLCQVQLPQYDCTFVNIGLLAVAEFDSYSFRNIYVDNISIDNAPYDNDLAAYTFTVDNKRIGVGEQSTFTVAVLNRGAQAEANYTVELYRDGSLAETANGVAVNPAESVEINFTFTATLDDAQAEEINWEAVITYANDENPSNNTSDVLTTSVRKPDVPAVSNLVATETSGVILLNWDAAHSIEAPAETTPVTITDDFESYEAFIIENIGDWTMYDLDGNATIASPRIPADYPHKGDPMAFQLFNVVDAGVVTDDYYDHALISHSGNQYLICPSADWPGENNDWLVSPRLDGRAQSISFYAKAATYDVEWIRIYYSTTDTHPDSFTMISEGEQVYVDDLWREYSYNLPDGAKYFAIQYCRRGVFLLIDDITYNIHNGAADAVTLLGYNVYRNGALINSELVTTNSYSDTNTAKGTSYTYRVTAVYEEGESDYSNEASILTTGISGSQASNGVVITTVDNMVTVKSISPCDITIFTADGKMVYNNAKQTHATIQLDNGVYIIKAGNTVRKIIL